MDWGSEECGEGKMSSAEGGLEVTVELLEWFKYRACCLDNTPVHGDGMDIAGDGVKMLVSK